jgi:hypothetical protein
MFELDGDFPFLWRLSAESTEGFCSVAMVVPYQDDEDRKDLTIETTVLSLSSDTSRSASEEVLEWNQDDISLFVKMVNNQRRNQNFPVPDTVRVDLSDPAIIEIINVVAAAGFGTAYACSGVLLKAQTQYSAFHCQIGGFASLNTVSGFKSCVVVAVEDDDRVCVLLDEIEVSDSKGHEQLNRHDLLLVKSADILHPEFVMTTNDLNAEITH